MKARIAYIDQIKLFLTCLVVAHHAAQAYGPTGGVWVVADKSRAAWMGPFFFINASFMMGLYFFISGYFMVFSLGRKSYAAFMRDRLRRLGIPLLFFTLLVFLPFNYMASDRSESLGAFFWNSYWYEAPRATGHLWFVALLLVFSAVYLLLHRRMVAMQHVALRHWWIWAYLLLLALASGITRLRYPIDEWHTWLVPVEVGHLPQYLSLFLLGTLFHHQQWLDQLKLRDGLIFLTVAVGTYLGRSWMPAAWHQHWLTESLVESLLCVGISMALLTFFRHFCNRQYRLTTMLSANAYGIYLFHLPLVIVWQSLLLQWQGPGANLKFALVTMAAILGAWGLSALVRCLPGARQII